VVGALGGLALALAAEWSTGDGGLAGSTLGAAAAYLPAVLLLGAAALALFGVLPGAEAVAWLVFAAAAVIAYLGDPLNMPDTILSLAPFNRVGYPPLEDVEATDLLGLSTVTVLLVGVALLGFRRRGIPHG
jgi:ABC-2 type transport system permease protein